MRKYLSDTLCHESIFLRNIYLSQEEYKITPCDSANAFGGTIPNNIGTNSATNGSGGGTGGNFIFFEIAFVCLTISFVAKSV